MLPFPRRWWSGGGTSKHFMVLLKIMVLDVEVDEFFIYPHNIYLN